MWPVRNRQGQISPGAFLTSKAREWQSQVVMSWLLPLLLRSSAQRGGKPTLPGAPSTLVPPMSHPTTLLEGLDSSRGFSPWNCLCAGTSEQMRLVVVVQTPRISLTHSFVVLQLGKGVFHGRGLCSVRSSKSWALTCLTKPAQRGKALGRKRKPNA